MPRETKAEVYARGIESLVAQEARARTPKWAARLRDTRHEMELGLRMETEGVMPCPECGELAHFPKNRCTACGAQVTLAAFAATSDLWKLYFFHACLFGPAAVRLADIGLHPGLLPLRVAAVVVFVPAAVLGLGYSIRVLEALRWRFTRPGA
jgi:hypothetical protein